VTGEFLSHPHRRFDPLTGRRVLVLPQRTTRPWAGQREASAKATAVPYDPVCYLCPGNDRAQGQRNPSYTGCHVFDNDFPALLPVSAGSSDEADEELVAGQGLFRAAAQGTCRVICYSPDHAKSMAELPAAAVAEIVDTWCAQSAELGARHRWVQIFENRGAQMGCSNPHPHGQIWAAAHLPDEVANEDRRQRAWHEAHGRALLLDVVGQELAAKERVILDAEHWLAIVPFWAVWPFEVLLLPRAPVQRLPQLGRAQRTDLAAVLKTLIGGFDRLFDCSFPYSMGWHGAPFDEAVAEHWQLHAHFYPPLLRSASVRKFMVGYELLAEAQRDLTPEQSAERLRQALA
jgi:UDPglucose--hexose-1-phosphate uridylyltransferase